MKIVRRAAASIATVPGILSLATGTPAQAAADTALSAPTAICGGAGWTLIDHHDLINRFTEENFGVVTLYYGNGYNCAATTKRVPSASWPTRARSCAARTTATAPSRAVTRRAGSGRLRCTRPPTCVKWGGGISDDTIWRVLGQPDLLNWGHGDDC